MQLLEAGGCGCKIGRQDSRQGFVIFGEPMQQRHLKGTRVRGRQVRQEERKKIDAPPLSPGVDLEIEPSIKPDFFQTAMTVNGEVCLFGLDRSLLSLKRGGRWAMRGSNAARKIPPNERETLCGGKADFEAEMQQLLSLKGGKAMWGSR